MSLSSSRGGDDPGGGGTCGRCQKYGQPWCVGRRPGTQSYSRVHPASQGTRSRPNSPLLHSRPSSPSIYSPTPVSLSQQHSLQHPVYVMQPSPSPLVMGMQQPWHYHPAAPTPTASTPLPSLLTQVAVGEPPGSVPSYQHQTVSYTPVLHGYQTPVYPAPQYSQMVQPQHPASYYLGPAYMHHGSAPASRPSTPDWPQPPHSDTRHSADIEDITMRPCGVHRIHSRLPSVPSGSESVLEPTFRSDVPPTPSLKLSVASLPSPLDVPGIPIQDEVCPFHERTSEWLAFYGFHVQY